jgi:sec-independent protein translocase protein TatB
MFGLGWTEILVIAAIAVLVVPPKDLPGLMRTVGQGIGRMRRMASQFQRELETAVRDEELDKLRKQMSDIGRDTDRQLRAAANPKELTDLRRKVDELGRDTNREAGQVGTGPRPRAATVEAAEPAGGPAMTPLPDAKAAASGEAAADKPRVASAAATKP